MEAKRREELARMKARTKREKIVAAMVKEVERTIKEGRSLEEHTEAIDAIKTAEGWYSLDKEEFGRGLVQEATLDAVLFQMTEVYHWAPELGEYICRKVDMTGKDFNRYRIDYNRYRLVWPNGKTFVEKGK